MNNGMKAQQQHPIKHIPPTANQAANPFSFFTIVIPC